MNERENWLRTVEFRYPEWIPCSVSISPLTWNVHREGLRAIVLEHPRIFRRYDAASPNFYDEMPPVYRQGERYTDNWGCTWYNIQGGLEGQVVGHPLADWGALATYRMPDPLICEERGLRDWAKARTDMAESRAKGWLVSGNGERLFDRLYFLRGFENLMTDLATDAPELPRLIEMLKAYELKLIGQWLSIGVDAIGFHTDIGTQRGLMIHPNKFRQYIKPLFATLFQTCRQAGVHVTLSSDGCLLEIVDDLIECGVSMHDPQLRANTLQGIMRAYRGKLCANLDLDRQSFPFLTAQQLREQIKEVVDTMALPEGGLMVLAAIYGKDVPLRNIAAICEAMEDYCC
jgi:uroporphyrinogen decarboxylase